MPRLIMIAVHKNGNKIEAIRFINYESLTKSEVVDIPYAAVVQTLKVKGDECFDNVTLENGQVKGVNGSIDRYGVIENGQVKSSPTVIINKVVDNNGNTLGYECCRAKGEVARVLESQLVTALERVGIANGKLVTVNGNKIISAIEGKYNEIKINDATNKEKSEASDKQNAQPEIDREIIGKMVEMMKDRRYIGSHVSRVIEEVRRTRAISDEQRSEVEEVYRQWHDEDRKIADGEKESLDYLTFTEMNKNEWQVARINDLSYNGVIVIPATYKGKKVTSIGAEAFKQSAITGVSISENINDIGQSAFSGCKRLKFADLSAGKHRFIASYTFFNCKNMNRIDIGSMVERIHEYAFAETYALQKIKLPSVLHTIARKAFYASGLREIITGRGLRIINDGAFERCIMLSEIDLHGVTTIGSRAFSESGLESIIIPSTTLKIGRYAFYCDKLKEVNIEDGVEDIGEGAFTSPSMSKTIDKMYIPKSVKVIGNGALKNVVKAYVYHGTVAENFCLGFGVDFEYLDEITEDNSAKARKNAAALGTSVIDIIKRRLERELTDEPKVDLNREKLLALPINEQMAKLLNIEFIAENDIKEPKAPFVEAVNYLTATQDLYKTPFESSVMRCLPILYVEANYIYSVGGNRIIRFSYVKKDNLDEASFIAVTIGNTLAFVCEDSNTTEIVISSLFESNRTMPYEILHTGDTIGKDCVISGEKARSVVIDSAKERLGVVLQGIVEKGMVQVLISAHDKYCIDVRSDNVLKISDQRTYDKQGKVRRGTPDCLNITGVIKKEELYKIMKGSKKTVNQNKKFFDEIRSIDDTELQLENRRLSTVYPECISEIYVIAKKFKERVGSIEKERIDVSMLGEDLFKAVANSYWMVEKDSQWYSSIGKRSLNIIGKYTIGSSTVEEYVSNQIVKFSNPYMQGGKGAHIFVVKRGNLITGIYASKLSLKRIAMNLYEIMDYDEKRVPMSAPLSKDGGYIESIDTSLFFKFYAILQKESGWRYTDFNDRTLNTGCEFAISMYKPTGVMYIVMYNLIYMKSDDDKKMTKSTIEICNPLFKIGDIDRALEIANTTNTLTRGKKLAEELVAFGQAVHDAKSLGRVQPADLPLFSRYVKVREMAIAGETRMSEYEGLVNERLLFMIGINSDGEPKVYSSAYKQAPVRYTYESEDDDDFMDDIDETEDNEEINSNELDDNDEEDVELDGIELEAEQEEELDDEYEEDYEDEAEIADDYDDDSEEDTTSSMIEMLSCMSSEELASMGLTEQQRDDMISKLKSGELQA